MKPVYWRPQKVSPTLTLAIGALAAISLTALELVPRFSAPAHEDEKMTANQHAQLCRFQIRESRKRNGLPLNRMFDPLRTGLVGTNMTPITSKPASLEAKQLSLHPQFPSAVVQMLRDAGVRPGDSIAVGWTGSFPGLNVALLSAIEAMHLEPVIVASVTASQYGANEPELTWLDMENVLSEAGLTNYRSMAATIGGPGDSGLGMDAATIEQVRDAIDRNGIWHLATRHLSEAIEGRMEFIRSHNNGRRFAAYVNVGGGAASCGGEDGTFPPGVTLARASNNEPADCVMQRFADEGIPVVHLANPRQLVRDYGMSASMETWNAGNIVRVAATPNRFAAFGVFVAISLILQAFILKDTGNQGLLRLKLLLRGQPILRAVGQTDGPQLMA